jgi:hypothetical protein
MALRVVTGPFPVLWHDDQYYLSPNKRQTESIEEILSQVIEKPLRQPRPSARHLSVMPSPKHQRQSMKHPCR